MNQFQNKLCCVIHFNFGLLLVQHLFSTFLGLYTSSGMAGAVVLPARPAEKSDGLR